jgi:hypothetical protein
MKISDLSIKFIFILMFIVSFCASSSVTASDAKPKRPRNETSLCQDFKNNNHTFDCLIEALRQEQSINSELVSKIRIGLKRFDSETILINFNKNHVRWIEYKNDLCGTLIDDFWREARIIEVERLQCQYNETKKYNQSLIDIYYSMLYN